MCSKLNIEEGETTNSNNKKSVKFADGISPGEGTSPSAGEELSSPPPPTLPKEKRYKKTRVLKKSKKKKVKVSMLVGKNLFFLIQNSVYSKKRYIYIIFKIRERNPIR